MDTYTLSEGDSGGMKSHRNQVTATLSATRTARNSHKPVARRGTIIHMPANSTDANAACHRND